MYGCGRKEGNAVQVDAMTGSIFIINPDKVKSTQSIVTAMDANYAKNNKKNTKIT